MTGAYRYTSRRLDAETGLYYYRARMYSPALGRFLQPDPIGFQGGLNLYAYVGNDPLNGVDPNGLFVEQVASDIAQSWSLTGTIGVVVPGAQAGREATEAFQSGSYGTAVVKEAQGMAEAAIAVLTVGEGSALLQGSRVAAKSVSEATTVVGRVKDLQSLQQGERSPLDRLPDLGSPKANWSQNSGVLRQEMSRGIPIRDASPGNTGGQFLNAERNQLRDRGWTFDPKTNYWMPPKP